MIASGRGRSVEEATTSRRSETRYRVLYEIVYEMLWNISGGFRGGPSSLVSQS